MKIGDRVRFVGREKEIGQYHADFVQLMGQTGMVVETNGFWVEVVFEGFKDEQGGIEFACFKEELELVV